MTPQDQAQRLYFQTDLSKTEIASQLGLSRRTLHHWIKQHDWARLKKSAECIPAFLAENCYQLLGNFTEHLLSEERRNQPPSVHEIAAVYKLTLSIGKLKARRTLCETMEFMNQLTETIGTEDVDLALKVQPYFNKHINAQAAGNHRQYAPSKMQDLGYIPTPDPDKVATEALLDEQDLLFWAQEKAKQQTPAPQATNKQHPAPQQPSFVPPSDLIFAPAFAPAVSTAPVQRSIREMLRGSATTGPGKTLRHRQPVAA